MATRIDSWCGALDTYKQAEIYIKWIGREVTTLGSELFSITSLGKQTIVEEGWM